MNDILDFDTWLALRHYVNTFNSANQIERNTISGRSFRLMYGFSHDRGNTWSLTCDEWTVFVLGDEYCEMDVNHIIDFTGSYERFQSDLILIMIHNADNPAIWH